MTIPEHLQYTRDHYWIRMEGEQAVIGLTENVISEIGMIVFMELPERETVLSKGQYTGYAETVDHEKDMLAPLSGKVMAVNTLLERVPQLIHESPYEKGWLYRMELSNLEELQALWDSHLYSEQVGEL